MSSCVVHSLSILSYCNSLCQEALQVNWNWSYIDKPWKRCHSRVHPIQHWWQWIDLKPEQNGQHYTDNISKCIFSNEKYCVWSQLRRSLFLYISEVCHYCDIAWASRRQKSPALLVVQKLAPRVSTKTVKNPPYCWPFVREIYLFFNS